MRMASPHLIAILVLAPTAHAGIGDVAWLAGTWCGENRDTFNEETWLAPRAGSMVGLHRDSKAGRLKGFEYFRIVEDADALVYWTQPGGAPAIAFRASAIGKDHVDFSNPAHDYPKRIRYRLVDANTLHARIDDGRDEDRGVEWTWHRECTPPVTPEIDKGT